MEDAELIERLEAFVDVQRVVKDYESGRIRVVLNEQAGHTIVNDVVDMVESKYAPAGLTGDERGHAVMHFKPKPTYL